MLSQPARMDEGSSRPMAVQGPSREPAMAMVAIGLIDSRRGQPRRTIEEEGIRELTQSVRDHGVLQPIRLRRCGPRFEVVAGHRRLAAAGRAGLVEVPAIIVDADDRQVALQSLIENVQREDLNPIDRGEALRHLRVTVGIKSWEEVARLIGLSRRHVYHLLNVTQLPEPIREDVRAGLITEKHGRALLRLKKCPEVQMELWQRITSHDLTGDEALVTSKELLVSATPDGDELERRVPREYPVPTFERAIGDLLWLLPRTTMRDVRPLRPQLAELARNLGDLMDDAFGVDEAEAGGNQKQRAAV
jgi:ParB/RepB/Spo0J family partition protein